MCMRLADAERTERLSQNLRRAKQENFRQAKQLGLRSCWKAEDAQWQIDLVKQAKQALAAQLHDSECSVQQLQEQVKEANFTIQQLITDKEEIGTEASQLKEKAQRAEQQAKAEAAAATSMMEARDKAIQELCQAQRQIQHLHQLQEEQQAKAEAAAATSMMEARDIAIQELSQAQRQIQHLHQRQEELLAERQQMAPVIDEAQKLRRNMEHCSADSKLLTTAVF